MYMRTGLSAADLDIILKSYGYTDGEITTWFERMNQCGEAIPDHGMISLIRTTPRTYDLYVEEDDDQL